MLDTKRLWEEDGLKGRFWLSVLFWGLTLFLVIRYAHWILAGFATLFLLTGLLLLAGGLYLRQLWKKARRELEQMAAAAEAFTPPSPRSSAEAEAWEGPVIHIEAETLDPPHK